MNLNTTRIAATLELPAGTGASNKLSKPSFALATLPDLPNEVLFIVTHNLDSESLFNLGLTCQRMNTFALNHFFSKNNITDPATGYYLPKPLAQHHLHYLPIQPTTPLRNALYVHHLLNLDCVLSPNAKSMHEEVDDLCVLAERFRSIKNFKLSFRYIDSCSRYSVSGLNPEDMRILTGDDKWYKSVTSLLDNVLDKSCSKLDIEGGDMISNLHRIPSQTLDGIGLSFRWPSPKVGTLGRLQMALNSSRHLAILKNNTTSTVSLGQTTVNGTIANEAVKLHKNADAEGSLVNSKQATQATHPRQRNLIAARIRSDMFLGFPFSKWTLATLNAASSTLTKLTLEMIFEAGRTWKTFSGHLSLPLLADFSLSGSFHCEKVPEFMDIEIFLMNHPSIQALHLYAVQLPPSSFAIPCPTFQNLVKFNGHPFYIIWLLKRVDLDKTGLPNLEHLGMSPDHDPPCNGSKHFWGFQPQHFEPALKAIARFRRKIVLAFTFDHGYADIYSIENWLESQVRKGRGCGSSIFSQLSNVATLVINGRWEECGARILAIIPGWLQLFPSLQHLVVNVSQDLKDPDFFAAVEMLCPCLESMVVNWVDIKGSRKAGNPWLEISEDIINS